MRRRSILKAAAGTPIFFSSAALAKKTNVVTRVSESYFRALPETKPERNNAIVGCANDLCKAKKTIAQDTIEAAVEAGETSEDTIRRIRFGVRILNEYNLTNTIDESLIAKGEKNLKRSTAYIPLLGSFNHLLESACEVEVPNPEPSQIKNFLYASLAFGIEVALWSIGAPYQMAWRSTRFMSNRTLLRFARHGCRGCVALAMSEIHWAIRASVYNHGVTGNRVEFISGKIRELQDYAKTLNYDVNLAHSEEEIQTILRDTNTTNQRNGPPSLPRENKTFIEEIIEDLPEAGKIFDNLWDE